MASSNRQGRMVNYINYRMKVTMLDGRQMSGQMLAFDKHMNLVLADTEEFRRVKRRQRGGAPGAGEVMEIEEKRSLGLIILRGTNIVSLSVEGPPPADPSARLGTGTGPTVGSTLAAGGGIARPAGRGVPSGGSLAGPAPGVGGPGAPPFPGPGAPPPFNPAFAGRGAPPGGPGFQPAPPGSFPAPPGAPPGFQVPMPPGGLPGAGPPGGFPGRGGFPPGGFPR